MVEGLPEVAPRTVRGPYGEPFHRYLDHLPSVIESAHLEMFLSFFCYHHLVRYLDKDCLGYYLGLYTAGLPYNVLYHTFAFLSRKKCRLTTFLQNFLKICSVCTILLDKIADLWYNMV